MIAIRAMVMIISILSLSIMAICYNLCVKFYVCHDFPVECPTTVSHDLCMRSCLLLLFGIF